MDVRIDSHGKYFSQRVAKESVAALIRTTDHLIVGYVYIRPDYRLKDELNSDAGRMIAVTEARVYNEEGTKFLFATGLLLLSYNHVLFLSPLDAVSATDGALWAEDLMKEAV
jgi:hypothetical protein